MFTRVKTSRNSEYLQVVENYRDDGRVRQRLIMYVGHYDSLDDALERMKWELTRARRRATLAEREVERLAGANYTGRYREEGDEWAAGLRAEAERLAEKLAEVRRFVEEHPDVLERDRARAERASLVTTPRL